MGYLWEKKGYLCFFCGFRLAFRGKGDIVYDTTILRGRAEVARQAHNLEAVGSIPTPATKDFSGLATS